MAEFIYTTSKEIRGPWFFDSDRLESLDKVLDEEWARLSALNETKINERIDNELKDDYIIESARMRKAFLEQDNAAKDALDIEEIVRKRREDIRAVLIERHYREERSIIIYLKKNKKIPVKSFSDALREPILLDEVPIGFEVTLKNGDIKGDIKLSRTNGSLEIAVSPEDISESKEFFAALQRWSSAFKPPRWQQLWKLLNPLQWVIWLTVLWASLFFLTDSDVAARRVYAEQARELLKKGVTQDNQLKAIEIILALESKYVPPDISQISMFPGWYKFLFFGGLIVCIILSITPKSRLGIGKGQEIINRWRTWMRIVFIVVPSFIFLNIIWPYISSLVFGR